MKIEIGRGSLKLEQIAAMCGGTLVGSGCVSAVCTDSREATDGGVLFVVTVGERVDAHHYMKRAYEGGCRLFLCQRIPEEMRGLAFGAVVVKDSIRALGAIAREYTRSMARPTVAVTGSVGKTTTKELISAVLGQVAAVHKTKANHNSTVGLPMSMLEATGKESASVVEMGMSGFGEIELMSWVASPNVACVTNIGSSHLELLGTRENICRAKLEITRGMEPGGVLILNGDEPLLANVKADGLRIVYVSLERAADVAVSHIRYSAEGSVFDVTLDGVCHKDLRLSAIGRPFVWAAAFAVAVAKEMGIDMETVRRGLLSFANAAMRQDITEVGGITFIEDCYNASPESVRAAIDVMRTLSQSRNARMVALLGDMRELGEESESFHRGVGSYYVENGGGLLFTFGPLAENIAKGAVDAGMDPSAAVSLIGYEDDEAVVRMGELVCASLAPGDILLVKASRAIGAERVLSYIKQKRLAK